MTTSPEDWCVLQYHRVAAQDGMVLAFRRHLSPHASYDGALKEIAPEAKYAVSFYPTYGPAKARTMAGSKLQHLKLEIADSPGSLVVEYKNVLLSDRRLR